MADKTRIICWQGWRVELPRRWDPVKLEGDHSEGHALFADTLRPRLGLRWQTLRKKSDSSLAVQKAMQAEVGQLAAKEAKIFFPQTPVLRYSEEPDSSDGQPGSSDHLRIGVNESTWQSPLLYTEPAPPGRDVFSAYSEISGRLLQVVYHAHRRENLFAADILKTLVDQPMERAAWWSIFDLNLVIPGGMNLKSQRLNAGDLALTFNDRHHEVTIRQIAVAQLALQRQSLDNWIGNQQKASKRFHHPTAMVADTMITINHRDLPGRISRMQRRLRYGLMWNVPRKYTTIGLHDSERDRLVLLHGTDESLLQVLAATVGTI